MSKNTTNLHNKLNKIQVELNAPKNMYNSFGKYKYRNLEGILEGLKPLLKETETTITISDEIIMSDGLESEYIVINKNPIEVKTFRVYIKSTVTISDGKDSISVSAFARESSNKTGMDASQLSGSCSSYARKYACNGLFAIDDTKDADSMDNSGDGKAPFEHTNYSKPKKMTVDQTIIINDLVAEIGDIDIEEKTQKWLLGEPSVDGAKKMINKLKQIKDKK